jgi:hypothetical protein
MHMEIEKPDFEKELLLDFAQLKLDNISLSLKQELDLIPLEEIDKLINAFKKIGCHADEVLFLQSLVALKMTKKNMEATHYFNQIRSRLTGSSVE